MLSVLKKLLLVLSILAINMTLLGMQATTADDDVEMADQDSLGEQYRAQGGQDINHALDQLYGNIDHSGNALSAALGLRSNNSPDFELAQFLITAGAEDAFALRRALEDALLQPTPNKEIIQFLLDHGAKDTDGRALMAALGFGELFRKPDFELAHMIIQSLENPTITTYLLQSLIFLDTHPDKRIIQFLLDHGAKVINPDVLQRLISLVGEDSQYYDLGLFDRLLQTSSVNIDEVLELAAGSAHNYPQTNHNRALIQLLLDHGARDAHGQALLNVLTPHFFNNTAGEPQLANMLLQSGASVGLLFYNVDSNGTITSRLPYSALIFAIRTWRSENMLLQFVPVLLQYAPHMINQRDPQGNTALTFAQQRGFVQVAQWLQQQGGTN